MTETTTNPTGTAPPANDPISELVSLAQRFTAATSTLNAHAAVIQKAPDVLKNVSSVIPPFQQGMTDLENFLAALAPFIRFLAPLLGLPPIP